MSWPQAASTACASTRLAKLLSAECEGAHAAAAAADDAADAATVQRALRALHTLHTLYIQRTLSILCTPYILYTLHALLNTA